MTDPPAIRISGGAVGSNLPNPSVLLAFVLSIILAAAYLVALSAGAKNQVAVKSPATEP